jgi:hypothetical protein
MPAGVGCSERFFKPANLADRTMLALIHKKIRLRHDPGALFNPEKRMDIVGQA